jgi:hypothetical protein
MGKFINTFNQGMDKDSSRNKYDNTHYYEAFNARIVSQEGLSGGALENMLGNLNRIYSSTYGYIIGHYVLRDHIIFWTTLNNSSTPSAAYTTDRIWKVPIADIEALTTNQIKTFSITRFHLGGNLIYQGTMMLCTGNEVKAIGRYDSANLEKVYWVDDYNKLRHINLVHNADTNDLANLSVDKLEVISNVDFSQPLIEELVGGNLKSGKIQYCYQLYTVNGSETSFSPMSDLVHLTSYSDTLSGSTEYRGSDLDVSTGKAVRCSVTVNTAGFTRARIVAVHYTSLHGDPEIRVVEEREIAGTLAETFTFIDTGTNLGTYTLTQLRTQGTLLFSAKELETKDNILFPANIVEEGFNVTYDARAYRFGGENSNPGTRSYQQYAIHRQKARIYEEDDSYYTINGRENTLVAAQSIINGEGYRIISQATIDFTLYGAANNNAGTKFMATATVALGAGDSVIEQLGWWTYSGGGSDVLWENIPATADAINKFNDISLSGDHNYRFMYQSDGGTLGGRGPNVRYEFKLKKMRIDEMNAETRQLTVGLEGTVDNPSFYNYASPYNVAKYLGYHRDEVYRFGIVFFDKKGRSSFVKWIGDIRMPGISSLSEDITYELTGTPTYQEGTIDPGENEAYEYHYIGFGDESYWYQVQPGDSLWDIGNYFYNTINTNSDYATCSSLTGGTGVFTITFDKIPGPYTVITDPVLSHYTQTQAYSTTGTSYHDFSIAFHDDEIGGDGKIYTNVLYPYFDIRNVPSDAVNYQIVRVKRESNDRTVMAQGMIGPTVLQGVDPNTRTHGRFNLASGWYNEYTFFSPEISFNENLTRQSNDQIQEVGEFGSDVTAYTAGNLDVFKYRHVTALNNHQTPASTAIAGEEHYSNSKTNITDGSMVRQDGVESTVYTYNYYVNNSTNNTDRGLSFVFRAANTSWRSKNQAYNVGRRLINYRRFIFSTQYGGNTYAARNRSNYIAASSIRNSTDIYTYCYGGDTFIGFFDHLYSSWEQNSATSTKPEAVYFPCESSINVALRHDDSYHRVYGNSYSERIHDTAGVWSNGTSTQDYAQPKDLYVYNSVYSKENDTKLFINEPFDWTLQTTFDTRVYASSVKTPNELSDSWLKFAVLSYKDVDPQFGEITALKTINDQMLFFQPKAFGVLSINERALLQTGSISQLSLGTSGVLERFDYAKTGIGVSDKRHLVLTQNGLYWVDIINKAMFKFTSGSEEISLMKGMDSYFKTNVVSTSTFLAYHDPQYKEVYLTDNTNNWTVVYNELTDSFVTHTSFYPILALNYNDQLFTSINRLNFYRHNDFYASRCLFHGGNYQPTTVTLLINPSKGDITLFNNLEWLTETYNSAGADAYTLTWNNITYWNSHQHSGTVTLTLGTNRNRRTRRWRTFIPRAVYKADGSTLLTERHARFRDSHLFVKFSFTNTSNNKLIAHDIITSHTLSNK